MALPTAYFMSGPPGAGKSTEVKRLKSRLRNYSVISVDDYIEEIARDRGISYGKSFSMFGTAAVWNCAGNIKDAVEAGKNIIIDQTNLNEASRAAKMKMLPTHYSKVAYVFNPPWAELMRVHTEREKFKDIPCEVIESMYDIFTMPTKSEGFDVVMVMRSGGKAF